MSASSSNPDLNALFAAAVRKLQQGDIRGALGGLKALSKQVPNNPMVLHHMAICHMHLGQFAQSRKLYETLHNNHAGDPDTLTNLAISYQEEQRRQEAKKAAAKALSLNPDHPRATNLLGTIHASEGDLVPASRYFRQSLRLEPGNADTRLNSASCLFQLAEFEEAYAILKPLLGPEAPVPVLTLAGQIALESKNRPALHDVVRRLTVVAPSNPETMRLDLSLSELGKEHDTVILKARQILDHNVRDDVAWHSLGQALFLSGRVAESIHPFEQAIDIAPGVARYRNSIGLVYAAQGDKASAEARFREAIAISPGYGEAYRSLSALKRFCEPDDPDLSLFADAWTNPDYAQPARCKIGFGLGKALDDCADYARAASVYREANALQETRSAEIASRHIDQFERMIAEMTAPPDQTLQVYRDASPRPLFILGMPRSGTTLVEQILSRSPEITACGELSFIERCVDSLNPQSTGVPSDIRRIDSASFEEQAKTYLRGVAEGQDVSTAHFTDKMPLNFRYIWFICAMFPNAGIIHCRRHPLDVVLSNYFQLYGANAMGFTYDLTALARYYAAYRRLMIHWMQLFPARIHTVQYESLVADNRATTEYLISALNLDWHDHFLHHERSDAAVRTASIWQVRRRLYSSSVGRWKNYETLLQPAIGILQAEGVLDESSQEIPD